MMWSIIHWMVLIDVISFYYEWSLISVVHIHQ